MEFDSTEDIKPVIGNTNTETSPLVPCLHSKENILYRKKIRVTGNFQLIFRNKTTLMRNTQMRAVGLLLFWLFVFFHTGSSLYIIPFRCIMQSKQVAFICLGIFITLGIHMHT